ncbi:hypothetical protein SRHO_G00038980 [Serrasalmus rhombeus]
MSTSASTPERSRITAQTVGSVSDIQIRRRTNALRRRKDWLRNDGAEEEDPVVISGPRLRRSPGLQGPRRTRSSSEKNSCCS